MVILASAEQARSLRGRIPELAILRVEQFTSFPAYDPEVDGVVVVMQEGDTLESFTMVDEAGLLGVIDEEWPGFEYISYAVEKGRRVYEMVIQIDDSRMVAVIIPDRAWVDERLRRVLELEGQEVLPTPGGVGGFG